MRTYLAFSMFSLLFYYFYTFYDLWHFFCLLLLPVSSAPLNALLFQEVHIAGHHSGEHHFQRVLPPVLGVPPSRTSPSGQSDLWSGHWWVGVTLRFSILNKGTWWLRELFSLAQRCRYHNETFLKCFCVLAVHMNCKDRLFGRNSVVMVSLTVHRSDYLPGAPLSVRDLPRQPSGSLLRRGPLWVWGGDDGVLRCRVPRSLRLDSRKN